MLDGIRVLDLTRLLPGPFCTGMLADMGADVIRVDQPGEEYTIVGVVARTSDRDRVNAYDGLARNKRSLSLNLKAPQARQVLYRLVETADVVIESYRPGVAAALGVDYQTLSAIRPDLIYCSISAYGQDGPYRNIPAHDVNIVSAAGLLSFPGDDEGRPVHPGTHVADLGSGMYATVGILAALFNRTRTGAGTAIDIAMLDCVVAWLAHHASLYFLEGTRLVSHPGERKLDLFPTADGKLLTIVPAEQRHWNTLCEVVGHPELKASWPLRDREARRRALGVVGEALRTKTRDEWWAIFQERVTGVSPLYDLPEALEDAQVLAREMVVEVDHPTFGPVRQLGTPLKFAQDMFAVRRLAAAPGADRDAILRELGWDESEIAALEAEGTFGASPRVPATSTAGAKEEA